MKRSRSALFTREVPPSEWVSLTTILLLLMYSYCVTAGSQGSIASLECFGFEDIGSLCVIIEECGEVVDVVALQVEHCKMRPTSRFPVFAPKPRMLESRLGEHFYNAYWTIVLPFMSLSITILPGHTGLRRERASRCTLKTFGMGR